MLRTIRGKGDSRGISGFAVNRGAVNRGEVNRGFTVQYKLNVSIIGIVEFDCGSWSWFGDRVVDLWTTELNWGSCY